MLICLQQLLNLAYGQETVKYDTLRSFIRYFVMFFCSSDKFFYRNFRCNRSGNRCPQNMERDFTFCRFHFHSIPCHEKELGTEETGRRGCDCVTK